MKVSGQQLNYTLLYGNAYNPATTPSELSGSAELEFLSIQYVYRVSLCHHISLCVWVKVTYNAGGGQERADGVKDRVSKGEWRNHSYGLRREWRCSSLSSKSRGFVLPERKKKLQLVSLFLPLSVFLRSSLIRHWFIFLPLPLHALCCWQTVSDVLLTEITTFLLTL